MNAGYQAARTGAALVDRTSAGRLRATGAKRLDLLHRLITQDVRSLLPGQGARAAMLTDKGRMIDDLRLYVREDHVLIVTSPGQSPAVQRHIESLRFRDDVILEDVTAATSMIDLVGPRAPDLLEAAMEGTGRAADLESLPRHHHRELQVAGRAVMAVRVTGLHERSLRLLLSSEDAPMIRDALLSRGAVPLDAEMLEVLRIERGVPRFGHEITLEHNPLEARLDDAISWTKGCYIGQEVVARLDSRHKVTRILSGLILSRPGAPVPAAGDPVDVAGKPGVEAGRVTSAAWSHSRNAAIALAFLRQESASPGMAVRVIVAGAQHEAVVSDLPFAV